MGAAIPLKTTGDESKALPSITPNPIESLSKTPTTEEVKKAVVFIANNMGLNADQFYRTIQCESGFNYDPPRWNDAGLAYGVAQFHADTFYGNCKGDYYSARDQIVCMATMWKEKIQWPWTCFTDLFR